MALKDVLTQDEIDTLLHGEAAEAAPEAAKKEAGAHYAPVDLFGHERVAKRRLPNLEMIHDRFGRHWRSSLFNLLRRPVQVTGTGMQMLRFSDYIHNLPVPSSLNNIRLRPLRGTALVVFEPQLIYQIVDHFFGGKGTFYTRVEGREFTTGEHRVIELLLQSVIHDLKEAWAPIMKIDPEFISSEVNPYFANIVAPTDIVIRSGFLVELEGGSGQVQITLPYAMVAPVRELLGQGVQVDRTDMDPRWQEALKEDLERATVEVRAVFGKARITLRQVLELRAEDVIPLDVGDTTFVEVARVPLMRGKFGLHRGKRAVRIEGFCREHKHGSELKNDGQGVNPAAKMKVPQGEGA